MSHCDEMENFHVCTTISPIHSSSKYLTSSSLIIIKNASTAGINAETLNIKLLPKTFDWL